MLVVVVLVVGLFFGPVRLRLEVWWCGRDKVLVVVVLVVAVFSRVL